MNGRSGRSRRSKLWRYKRSSACSRYQRRRVSRSRTSVDSSRNKCHRKSLKVGSAPY